MRDAFIEGIIDSRDYELHDQRNSSSTFQSVSRFRKVKIN